MRILLRLLRFQVSINMNVNVGDGLLKPCQVGGPFYYPTYTWQELNWDPNQGSWDFWYFCWNVTNADAPQKIRQVDYALSAATNGEPWINLGNYANYIKKFVIPLCNGAPINSSSCFSTQNVSFWADTTNSAERSYLYTTCTEYGLYQVPEQPGIPSLLSNAITPAYTQQWCTWAFPPGQYNSIPSQPDVHQINKYGGYNVSQKRLAHIDGDQDVWLDICYHSNLAPLRYTPNPQEADIHPQLLIAGAGHHWDSYGLGSLKNVSLEPQFIQNAHLWEIRTVRKWVAECKSLVTKRSGAIFSDSRRACLPRLKDLLPGYEFTTESKYVFVPSCWSQVTSGGHSN